MTAALADCPFCGGAARRGYVGPFDGSGVRDAVLCDICRSSVPGKDTQDAADKWNRRAAAPASGEVVAWRDIASAPKDRPVLSNEDFVRWGFGSECWLGENDYERFPNQWISFPNARPAPIRDGWDEAIEAAAKWHEDRAVSLRINAAMGEEEAFNYDERADQHDNDAEAIRALARPSQPASKRERCRMCGHVRKEHSYNGACYGLCGEFVAPAPDSPSPASEEEIARIILNDETHANGWGDPYHASKIPRVLATARDILALIEGRR